MKLENLEEFRTIVVMPGRFQPFHIGHKKAYQWLKKRFDEVYIATSDKIDLPKSPFSFDEKVEMIMATGISDKAVVKTRSPYRAVEVTENFNPGSTILVYAVSQKDMTGENPRFTFEPKRDGSLSYMQPFQTEGLRPILEHAYVLTIPVFEFNILDKPVISATQIRKKFIESNTSNRIKIIEELYGEFNEEIFEIFERKLKIADAVTESNNNGIYKSLSFDSENGGIEAYVADSNLPNIANFLDSEGVSPNFRNKIISKFSRIGVIKNIWVNEDNRGKGIGNSMLSEIIDNMFNYDTGAILLVVDRYEENKFDLEKWYTGFGFEKIALTADGTSLMMIVADE